MKALVVGARKLSASPHVRGQSAEIDEHDHHQIMSCSGLGPEMGYLFRSHDRKPLGVDFEFGEALGVPDW